MSGIAKFLQQMGCYITGYDDNPKTNININLTNIEKLENQEIKPNLIIYSAAIRATHPHILFAKKHNIPILSRAEILKIISEYIPKKIIAVTGSHGKTTVSSLITEIFIHCNKKPSFIIGGLLQTKKTNSSLDLGEHLIIEACESDKSFLKLRPDIAIITNIDHEHLGLYQNNIKHLQDAFLKFCYQIKDNGCCIICSDNKYTLEIINKLSQDKFFKPKIITYSCQNNINKNINNNLIAKTSKFNSQDTRFILNNLEFITKLKGEHNIQNILAAIACAQYENINTNKIRESISLIKGAKRRCEFIGYYKKHLIYDDYGHHPNEIKATLLSLKKSYPENKIILFFQPHRYSRTYELYNDFINALTITDVLFILPIYSASEDNIYNLNSEKLVSDCKKILNKSFLMPIEDSFIKNNSNKNIIKKFINHAENVINESINNNILLFQGAGNISFIANNLKEEKKHKNYA